MRWWDGTQWTAHTAATGPPAGAAASTDGFAIASLVLGLAGGSLFAIVFGFIARSRIKKSAGARGGSGFATAGIVLGFAWIAVIALIVTLGVTGVLDSDNADDYSGEERKIAQKIDEFEEAVDANDGVRLCDRILSPGYAKSFDTRGQLCPQYWSTVIGADEVQAEIDVESLTISGPTATAQADEGGDDVTFRLERHDGDWRIAGISSP